jgi:hypothetical protein
MKLGVITRYKIGYVIFGIRIINIFPERVIYNYITNKYKYYGTEYYISFKNKLYFLEEWQLTNLIDKIQHLLIQSILNKIELMLE